MGRTRRGRLGALPGALLAGVALAGLSGCGEASPASSPATSSASPSSPASPPTAPGTASDPAWPPPVSPTPPSESKERVRVEGRVVGVESGCVALVASTDVVWQLLGPVVAELEPGDDVIVVGAPRPGAQGCPDGAVLAVERVTAMR